MAGTFGFGTAGSSPPKRRTRRPDLLVYGEGTVYLLHAATPTGHAWIDEHISPDAPRLGAGVAVEHRYLRDIIFGAVADGLVVR